MQKIVFVQMTEQSRWNLLEMDFKKTLVWFSFFFFVIACYCSCVMAPYCLSVYFCVVCKHIITKSDKKLRISFKCQKNAGH